MISTVTCNPSVDKTLYVPKIDVHDTNRITKVEVDAGGKGVNCSRMLKELGSMTTAVTFLGGKTGEFVKHTLRNEGIDFQFVETATPTRTCIAIEEVENNPPTTFNEKGGPVTHKEIVDLLEIVKNICKESSYLAIGGSLPLGANPDIYNRFMQIAVTADCKVCLDTDGEPLAEGVKGKPFMIKPNRDEAERLLSTEFESKSDVARGAVELAKRGIELVVISLGKQGLVACYEGNVYDVAAPGVEVKSTIGSGDSLVAGILSGLENGQGIEAALKLGAAAGAATAMTDGTEIGQREDIDKLLPEVTISKASVKK